jgi:nicotinate-nucleotide adenylyltransferase
MARAAMVEKRGVMGGSFDPIHIGHLSICQQVAEHIGLSKVVLMPAAIPPHKRCAEMAPAEDRLAMCRLAVKNLKGLEVSDLEIRRGGISYTIDTVRELRKAWGPDVEIHWIIGSDMLADLPKWKDVSELLKLVRFAVADRCTEPLRPALWEKLDKSLGAEAVAALREGVVPVQRVDISATMVREMARRGERLRRFVRLEVEAYIRRKGLYGASTAAGGTNAGGINRGGAP